MRIFRFAWAVFIAGALLWVLYIAGLLLFSRSQDIYGIEQNVVYSLQLLIADNPLYTNPEEAPYNVVQYTPAYYAIADILANIFRISADNVYGVYLLARGLSIAFGLGVYVLIALLCRDFGLKGLMLATSLVLAIFAPMPWFIAARPDSMVAFFNFLSIYCFIQYLQKAEKTTLNLLLAGAAVAFGFYSKQTAVIFLGLFFIFPFYRHWLKDRLLLALGFGLGLPLAALLFLPYANVWPSPDNPYYSNIIGGVTNSLSFERALLVYFFYISIFFAFIILPFWMSLIVTGRLWQLANKKFLAWWTEYSKLDAVFAFLLFVFWGNTIISLLMAFKSASAINYLNESMLLAIILLGYFLSHHSIPEAWRKGRSIWIGMPIIILFCVLMMSQYLLTMYGDDLRSSNVESQLTESLAILEAEFSAHPDAYFIYYPENTYERWLHLYAYENALFEPREVYDVSYFDLSSLQAYIDDGRLRLLITDIGEDFPEDVYGYTNLQENFEFWQETSKYRIYRNRAANP